MYYVFSTDGAQIYVEDINPSLQKTVVLVHGWPINREMYEYQKTMLSENGYRVVSMDLRGFGKSQVTGDGYHYDQLADDVFSVIDHLNVPSVSLVGFSMGGAIVTRYMARFNNYKVSKLVLVGAAAPSFTKSENNLYGMTKEQVNALIQQSITDRPKMINDFGSKVFARNHSTDFLKWFQDICLTGSGIATTKTAISLRDEDVFYDLAKIQVPTAILHGKLDQICPYSFACIQQQQIPNSELYPFEYSGHGIFYDELDRFNETLLTFLEKK